MAKVAIISQDRSWAESLSRALSLRSSREYYVARADEFCASVSTTCTDSACVYVPRFADRSGTVPDVGMAENDFRKLASLRELRCVLLSSALIYGTGPDRPPFVTEDYLPPKNGGKRICDQWTLLERMAEKYLRENSVLTILRPSIVVPSPMAFSAMLASRLVSTLPGHDPSLQFLAATDLAGAIDRAIERSRPGIFNIAPDTVVPLHSAVRILGRHRIPVPRTLQRLTKPVELLDYWRYPWSVANDKAKKELGYRPAKSSMQALGELSSASAACGAQDLSFDDFGMDRSYIGFYGKTQFRFLSDYYWRIEDKGIEHIPGEGRAVLVGMHRGFMPWDGVMALHLIVKKTGRYPRFLTHPALLKFPFLANFMTKLGGVVACQQSADRILQNEGLLGIFPEGIQGAFISYRRAYQLQEFGRDAFVKIALRNRAPIVPFVTVGSAEIFPIFGKIRSRLWKRYTEWPCLPLTPTFPLLPIPLPSKWHTQFLPAIHIEKEYPPEAARDRPIVKAISLEVRTKMQVAVNEMLGRRRSIFFGSIFEPEAG